MYTIIVIFGHIVAILLFQFNFNSNLFSIKIQNKKYIKPVKNTMMVETQQKAKACRGRRAPKTTTQITRQATTQNNTLQDKGGGHTNKDLLFNG